MTFNETLDNWASMQENAEQLKKYITTESTSNSEDKPVDYNFPKFERSELIDTSQTQIFK